MASSRGRSPAPAALSKANTPASSSLAHRSSHVAKSGATQRRVVVVQEDTDLAAGLALRGIEVQADGVADARDDWHQARSPPRILRALLGPRVLSQRGADLQRLRSMGAQPSLDPAPGAGSHPRNCARSRPPCLPDSRLHRSARAPAPVRRNRLLSLRVPEKRRWSESAVTVFAGPWRCPAARSGRLDPLANPDRATVDRAHREWFLRCSAGPVDLVPARQCRGAPRVGGRLSCVGPA